MEKSQFSYEKLSKIKSFSSFHHFFSKHNILGKGDRFIHVEMDISNKCNLQCIMCYNSMKKNKIIKLRIITPDEFLMIASDVFKHTGNITLGLGNEPLLSSYFTDHLGVISEYRIPRVIVQTSGDLLNDKIIESIFKYGVSEIYISIDGAQKETYEKIRKGARFDRLIKHIQKINQYKQKYSLTHPIMRFNVVMMKSNIIELPAIVELAAKYNVEQINFCHVVLYKGLKMKNESLFFFKEESNQWLKEALELAKQHNINVVNYPKFFETKLESQTKISKANIKIWLKKLLLGTKGQKSLRNIFNQIPYCMFPFFHISINSGLQVLSCPFSHGEMSYATLSDENTVEKVWFGEKFTKLRTNILNSNPPSQCLKCSFLSFQNPGVKSFFKPRKP